MLGESRCLPLGESMFLPLGESRCLQLVSTVYMKNEIMQTLSVAKILRLYKRIVKDVYKNSIEMYFKADRKMIRESTKIMKREG